MDTFNSIVIPRSKSEPILHSNIDIIPHSKSDSNISKNKKQKNDDFLKFIRNDMNKFIPNEKYLHSYKV